MEEIVKITTLQAEMKEVNKKLVKFDKKLDSLSDKIDKGFANIHEEMGNNYVRKSEYEIQKEQTEKEIEKIRNLENWAVRLVLGAVITALLATILI